MVVRVGAALTCGTDLKVYRRGYHAMMLKPPIPFGHELAGVVAEVGEGVTQVRGGRPRGADELGSLRSLLLVPARAAESLRGSAVQQRCLCGVSCGFRRGSWRRIRCVVPDGMPFEHAALTEPLACVVRGLEESGAQGRRHDGGDRRGADRADVYACGGTGGRAGDRGGEARGPGGGGAAVWGVARWCGSARRG